MNSENGHVKRINFDSKKFEANGETYYIEDQISVGRWEEYQVLVPEINYGVNAVQLFEEIKDIYELQNRAKFADVSVRLHDLMTSAGRIADRIDPCLKMCTLFMNTRDEDRATISEAQMQQKITNWKAASISYQDFFLAAMHLIPGLRRSLLEGSPSSSREERSQLESLSR